MLLRKVKRSNHSTYRILFLFFVEDCTPGIHKCVEAIDDGDECAEKNLEGMLKMHIDLDVGMVILKQLLKPAEEWSGIKLEPVTVYGIRRYLRGSWMSSHVDRKGTFLENLSAKLDFEIHFRFFRDSHYKCHHKCGAESGTTLAFRYYGSSWYTPQNFDETGRFGLV